MPIVNQWKLYGRLVWPLLAPDEQPLAYSGTVLSMGEKPRLTSPEPERFRGAGERIAGGAWSVTMGGWVPVRGILAAVFGRAADGAWNSIACDLLRTLGTDTSVNLCVTDRRFLVLQSPTDALQRVAPFPILWQCPTQQVVRASVGWRMLAFGRLRITFRDGSWIVFSSLPAMGRRRARAIAAALTGPVSALPRPES